MNNARKQATRRYEDATPLLGSPEKLREQAEADGFLFFRNAMPKQKLDDVRLQILHKLDDWGLLAEGSNVADAVPNVERFGQLPFESLRSFAVPRDLYVAIQQIEAFHALAHDPALLKLFGTLFGEEVFLHPRNIARVVIPHPAMTETPPHQDFIYTQGSRKAWTCWMPLNDTPRELGSLSVLAGSHQAGILPVVANKSGTGGLEAVLCDLDYEWVEGDFGMGDLVIFTINTIHKALPHRMKDRVRLSVDFRYQPASEPIENGALTPHNMYEPDAWETIYKDWKDESLKYYWKKYELKMSNTDPNLFTIGDKLC